MIYLVLAGLAVSFVAGKLYGAKIQAKAIAEYLKVRAAFTTETGKLYAGVIVDLKTGVSNVASRIQKFL